MQVLVDVFVNYDCSLQAANLFERSMRALARLAALPEAGTSLYPPPVAQARPHPPTHPPSRPPRVPVCGGERALAGGRAGWRAGVFPACR